MTLSLLAELYQSVGRTFELASEQRPFNDILRHYAELANDTLALIRDARSATIFPGSQLFSSVTFQLAAHPKQPGGQVTCVQFSVRPQALVLRDLIKVFGHWHVASESAARAVARFDAFRVCNKSRFVLCAEFLPSADGPQPDETPRRVFFALRDVSQPAEEDETQEWPEEHVAWAPSAA
jgi:hypothetical protein